MHPSGTWFLVDSSTHSVCTSLTTCIFCEWLLVSVTFCVCVCVCYWLSYNYVISSPEVAFENRNGLPRNLKYKCLIWFTTHGILVLTIKHGRHGILFLVLVYMRIHTLSMSWALSYLFCNLIVLGTSSVYGSSVIKSIHLVQMYPSVSLNFLRSDYFFGLAYLRFLFFLLQSWKYVLKSTLKKVMKRHSHPFLKQ